MEEAFMRGGFSDDGFRQKKQPLEITFKDKDSAAFLLFNDCVKLMDFIRHIQKFLTGHVMGIP